MSGRHLAIFLILFAVGAGAAVVVRTAGRHPTPAPAATPAMTAPVADTGAATPAEAHPATVNSICPICAMPVDQALKTAEYRGKRIGFGCGACPATFAADPEKYGPAALANQVVK